MLSQYPTSSGMHQIFRATRANFRPAKNIGREKPSTILTGWDIHPFCGEFPAR